MKGKQPTRKQFLTTAGVALTGAVLPGVAAQSAAAEATAATGSDRRKVKWCEKVLVDNVPPFEDNGRSEQPTIEDPGTWGSMYGRMVKLANGEWLEANQASLTNAYLHDPNGGLRLRVHRSSDDGRSWSHVTTIADPGRDLDNPQLIQLDDGAILLACRSVIWSASYRIPVYKSTDNGRTWEVFSTIDSNEGGLRHGMYEPHMVFLPNGDLAVMYANSKYVDDSPSYSQIISERVSVDGGKTWGDDLWPVYEVGGGDARPGMPVWTRMTDGRYILVYEVCKVDKYCYTHYKYSTDGTTWSPGYEGHRIPKENHQLSGPYVLSLDDGRLVVTSNTHNVSISDDYGKTWVNTKEKPWQGGLWSSIYQTGKHEIAVVNSALRPEIAERSYNVKLHFGIVAPSRGRPQH